MVNAIILSLVIPALLLTLTPRIVTYFGGEPKRYMPWLYAASVLYMISWWLPSPLIEGRDTSFTTHFLGGRGVYGHGLVLSEAIFEVERALAARKPFSLFVLVSTLGVANELLEVVLYVFGRMPNGISDTSWDLLANTLGALTFYLVYVVFLPKQK